MIYYLVTEKHPYTMRRFLGGWGKAIAPIVRIVTYEQTRCYLRGGSLGRRWTGGSVRRLVNAYYETRRAPRPLARLKPPPTGHWIFGDVDRLAPQAREEAARFRAHLIDTQSAQSLHNDPRRAMGRYELLRTLREQGINDFDVYRLTEARAPQRYPVFLRLENDHAGAESDLLQSPEALRAAVELLTQQGRSREPRLVVEFHAERDHRGLYRKYSAWLVGEQLLAGHLFFGTQWMLKAPMVVDEETLREERAYLEHNPHEHTLREIFRLAQVDYGRVDYAIVDGRIQVYEINTNPGIPSSPAPGPGERRAQIDAVFNERMLASLRRLDGAPASVFGATC